MKTKAVLEWKIKLVLEFKLVIISQLDILQHGDHPIDFSKGLGWKYFCPFKTCCPVAISQEVDLSVVIIFVNQPKRFSQPLSRANWIHCAFPILNFWKPPKFCFAEVIKYTFFGISNATHKLMFMGVEHWRRASFFVHPCMFSICNYTRICLEWVKVGKHTDAFCILWPSNLTPLCTSFPKFHAASKWKANKWAYKQFHV